MNIIHPKVGTVEHFNLQEMILLDLSSLQYNPTEGVDPGRVVLSVEANFEHLQAVWYGKLKS